MAAAARQGTRIRIRGIVQGVGFRPWVYRLARDAHVAGTVCNDGTGVTIEAFADAPSLARFLGLLQDAPPSAAHIERFEQTPIDDRPDEDFVIVASGASAGRRASIPPDLATCEACASEIFDPANRRYRYPFTNCTNCGPRFSIATDVPYDRRTTTMTAFEMCAACAAEYANPEDRRFHAQPDACGRCGPHLTLCTRAGDPIDAADPIASAADALRDGRIVAVKGIGGFHLACDATSPTSVGALRARKRRDEKPFAVMVADLDAAEQIVAVNGDARRLLVSVERPIVLLPRLATGLIDGRALAANIAPGNRMLGVFLPYSPIHHLLLADARRPLVMTSANVSDEPIVFRNGEAVERLGAIADLMLLHDREIATRCDDSVAAIIAGAPAVLRRSRGYVPRPVPVPRRFAEPVLACGAMLKNTFCLAADDSAWLGPHIGDLENLETFDAYSSCISRFETFLDVHPAVVAHDLHPDYLSTRYALRRTGLRTIPVQHHHAHIASAMAEHGLDGPVIGLAFDGTGLGTDGTMWGGELLVADYAGFHRAATFRPLPLAGGDQAVREPWRIALAMLLDAFDGDAPVEATALRTVEPERRNGVAAMLRARVNAPLAHGVGRYFDGFGAMFLGRGVASFEGQAALEWNQAADPADGRVYPYRIDDSSDPWQLDFRPMIRRAVGARIAGDPVAAIAAAFHNTIAAAAAEAVRRVAAVWGPLPVVLSGGCFQNAVLAEAVVAALSADHRVVLHRTIPPGDGGIALGQAVIANAIVRGARSCV